MPRRVRPGRSLLLQLLLAFALGAPALAQSDVTPPVGARLRVWTPAIRGGRIDGRLTQLDSSRLTLAYDARHGEESIVIAREGIDSMQVSRGRIGARGRQGALVGGLGGGLLLAAAAASSESKGFDMFDSGTTAAIGFVLGAASGALVGGMIGHSLGHDRWEAVVLPSRTGSRGAPAAGALRVGLRLHPAR